MSLVAPVQRHLWIWVSVVVASLLVITSVIIWADLPGKRLLSNGQKPGEARSDELTSQAAWKLSVHASGVSDKLTKVQQRTVGEQAPVLKSLVRRVYDSMFIHPSRLPVTLKKHFAPAAALALKRSGAGTNNAAAVSTTLRKASIGIQAARARFAVASVAVKATSTAANATPFLHRSTLWLERDRKDWRVIGFSVDQAPVAARDQQKPADGSRDRQDKKKKRNRG